MVGAIDQKTKATVELAAGGLVWDRRGPFRRLGIVHRTVHDDWSLPKGKLEPGETPEHAALREVKEELGVNAQLGRLAGFTWYHKEDHPKLVLFWHMVRRGKSAFRPNAEINQVEWLRPAQALKLLTYKSERLLVVRQALKLAGTLRFPR
jgi:8-oxo-dGTP diphosphatase